MWLGPYIENVSGLGTKNQVITRAVLPLFFFHCSPGRRATVLFPLFMNVRDEDTTFRSVAMLYFGVQNKERSAHVLLPLFFHVASKERTSTVLLPFFYSKNLKTDAVQAGLFPLFAFGRSKETTWATTPLGFFYKDEKATRAAASRPRMVWRSPARIGPSSRRWIETPSSGRATDGAQTPVRFRRL